MTTHRLAETLLAAIRLNDTDNAAELEAHAPPPELARVLERCSWPLLRVVQAFGKIANAAEAGDVEACAQALRDAARLLVHTNEVITRALEAEGLCLHSVVAWFSHANAILAARRNTPTASA